VDKLVREASEALASNRADAISFVQAVGLKKTHELLEDAQEDLVQRIERRVRSQSGESFTLTQMRATLAQLQIVTRDLTEGMRDTILDVGEAATDHAVDHMIEYLADADRAFKGVGTQRLAISEAAMLENAREGVRASILRRLVSSGEPIEDADEEEHPAKLGILQRYGVETVGHFEKTLQRGFLARKSWSEMKDDITTDSPFLQQAPAYWAERIVRTEVHAAYNKAGWESIRQADDDLGDMVKILSSTFDERTGADSYAVHGQIRLPDEPFESWFGLFMHPPDRPNDRGVVVPHRISWNIPPYLAWRDAGEIMARWRYEGRKGRPPARPRMTTVSLDRFGKESAPEQLGD
jgi:hypothetical protein